jgi:hypothetical protein
MNGLLKSVQFFSSYNSWITSRKFDDVVEEQPAANLSTSSKFANAPTKKPFKQNLSILSLIGKASQPVCCSFGQCMLHDHRRIDGLLRSHDHLDSSHSGRMS